MSPARGARGRLRRLARLYRSFGPMLRPHRARIAGATAAMVGAMLAGLVAPWPMQMVIDGVLLGRRNAGMLGMLSGWLPQDPTALLVLCCVLVVAITAARAGFGYAQTILAATVGHRVVTELRAQLFARLQRLSLGFHSRQKTGDLLVRLTGDVSMLREVLLPALLDVASRVLVLVGMLALMAMMDPFLTLVAASLLPLLALVSGRYGRRIRAATRSQRKKEGRIASVAGEALSSVPVVQAFSGEDDVSERFATQNRRSLRAGLRTLRLEQTLTRSTEVVLAVGSALVLFFGARAATDGAMSPGELVVFLAYLRGMYRPVQGITRHVSRFNKAIACGERIFEVLESREQVAERPGARVPERITGEIVFENVTFGYDPERPVLRDVSFRIPAGQRVGLVGPSGSGKSTTLALLLRLHEPQSGRILVDGIDIRDLQLDAWRRQVAIVLQEPFLFGISARENILFGRPDATDDEVVAAARAAGADEFLSALPDGYDAILGERGQSLSRGQQQRVALARAVLRDAPILVFDEPTTGLDAATEREIVATLSEMGRGRTCLWIAHDLEQILGCDRVIVLRHGRVEQDGDPERLMYVDGALRRLFREVG
ncbi:MAG: ABC transporter ATP-binding protein [Acidobacteriota bacterium]